MSHLNDEGQKALQLDDSQRISYIQEDFFIVHPVAEAVLTELERLLQWPKTPQNAESSDC